MYYCYTAGACLCIVLFMGRVRSLYRYQLFYTSVAVYLMLFFQALRLATARDGITNIDNIDIDRDTGTTRQSGYIT